jgi:hypothetical protein
LVEQLDGLWALATETCHEDVDVFATRIRRTMALPPNASVAKRLLAKTMTGEQYQQLWDYYETLASQLARPNVSPEVPNNGAPSQDAPTPEPASPTQEKAPAVPFSEPSSASEAPRGAAGSGPAAATEGYATPEAIKALKRLAAQVSPEAAEDLADVMEHSPNGLLRDVSQRIEARLRARLHGNKAAAAA